MLRYTTELGLV